MMTLPEYLRSTGTRQTEFAERLKVRQSTVSKLVNGKVSPSLALALQIDRETGGKVPVSVWERRESAA